MDESIARQRFFIIQIMRGVGIAMVLAGIAIIRGVIDLPEVAAYVLIVLGLMEAFLMPNVLARMWASPKE